MTVLKLIFNFVKFLMSKYLFFRSHKKTFLLTPLLICSFVFSGEYNLYEYKTVKKYGGCGGILTQGLNLKASVDSKERVISFINVSIIPSIESFEYEKGCFATGDVITLSNCEPSGYQETDTIESSGLRNVVLKCDHHRENSDRSFSWDDKGLLFLVVADSYKLVKTDCKCNENFLNGECVAIDPATTWDKTNDLIYEYPDNNHDDAERCEPKKTEEVDGVVNSCSSAGNGTSTSYPIDCATGQKKYTEVDYQGFGLDALTYTRRYETTVEDDSLTFDTTAAMVSTGQGWQSETPRLVTKTFADGAKAVYFKLGSRIARIFFYPAGSDAYQTNGNMTGITLTEENGKQVVTLSTGQRYSFNSAGQVASYQPKMSNDDERYTYTWDGELLSKKENRFGRYLSFQYDDQNRLTQLTDQDGVSVYYQYDDAGNLAKVIYPDGTPDDLTDNPFKHYQFENTAFPNNVTGIVDQDGTQLATIAYNADGKATLSELNNSAERTEVSYPENGKAIVKFFRDVESDAYRQETYSYAKFRGRYQLTAKTITKCDNCELTTETWDYNDAELLERHTDPAGVITEWVYDSKARKIKTIVAKGTAQEQTTTYTWNETHNAIDTITTKTDVTTYTFDERGNRIATVVTPVNSGQD